MSATNHKKYELYGGAITVELPPSLIDASDLRQVPDQQEVFLSPTSDLSIIIEVLEKVNDGKSGHNPNDAIRFHFESLACDNSATSSTVSTVTLPPDNSIFTKGPTSETTPHPILLEGEQTVSKFNQPVSEADQVYIWMSLWRLNGIGNDGRGTDLVMTINLPRSSPVSDTVEIQRIREDAARLFNHATKSLKILDWGLFA